MNLKTQDNPEERAEELRQQIRHYSRNYYLVDDPTASLEIQDADFDLLVAELKQIEIDNPELAFKNSPTQKVGTAVRSNLFEEIHHKKPMISLDNAFSEEELNSWLERLGRLIVHSTDDLQQLSIFDKSISEESFFDKEVALPSLVCELKFDGLGISVLYENGRLVRAATRGDGSVGENVTENIIKVNSMPKQLKGKYPERLEVRGEIYLPISEFNRLNEARKKQGLKLYANPRNTAAGTLRKKDPASVAVRELSWWCYQLVEVEGKDSKKFSTHSESFEYIKKLGLPVNPEVKTIDSSTALKAYLKEMLKRRHSRDYETDGVVIKLNNLADQNQIGSTSHHPRWAIAYKFPPEEKKTILKDIRISIGSKGKATPFADLEAVFVGGSTVRVATLHNEDQVKEKDLYIGDTVIVRKAGDIIPEVVGSVKDDRKKGAKPWVFPTKCPCPLETKLLRKEGEAMHRCPSLECPYQQVGRIEHFASRAAMNIEGLGESWVQAFLENGLIKDVADIYTLDFEKLGEFKSSGGINGRRYRYGEKNATKLKSSVKQSKKQPLSKVLFGLSISNIGAVASQDIAEKFGNIKSIQKAKPEDFESIKGIGKIQAASIYKYIKKSATKEILRKLEKAGVNLKQPQVKTSMPQTFDSMSFVVTGTLGNMSREEAIQAIKERGGKVQSSVSKNTDFVVMGESPGSKKKKAEELNIPQLDKAAFQKMLKS